jgi:hypothetical protein
MNPGDNETSKIKVEDMMLADGIKPSQREIKAVADDYYELITWKSYRSGFSRMFRGYDFESYLALSRELFWNSISTKSNDLKGLELEFSIPFARKEAMDFLAKLVSLGVKPKIQGDMLDALGMKILNGIYKRWHFKNNEKVETFWELLYGIMNGTVCSYIGYLSTDVQRRYLDSYNPETGEYKIRKEDEKFWSDVTKCVVPIEDIYLPKIYERNIQKQGRLIWRTQMDVKDFYAEFGHYKMAKYVFPGNRIAEDSLYFRLLGGTGTTTSNKIDVLRKYDWIKDEFRITAGGILLNGLGTGEDMEFAPMPFNHKMAPFTWGIMNPLDEKFAYGLSVPFMVKDPHKILNTSFCVTPETKILTRDLRWVEAGSLQLGDKLLGFEEFGKENPKKKNGRGSTRQRHFEDSHVVATGRKIAPVYKVTLEDGTELKCTGNHRWLTWNWTGHPATWLRTDEIQKQISNSKRKDGVLLTKYFDVVEQDMSYESGYLSGLFDGEGSLSLGTSTNGQGKVSRGIQVSFSQQVNETFKKGIEFLEKKGFNYCVNKRKNMGVNSKGLPYEACHQTYLRGGFQEVMRFLMSTRPERLIQESWGKKKIADMIMQKSKTVKVISVDYIGEMEIVALETSSKTYIAEGFGAHNTMMVERELRAIDPPIITSDLEAPEFIFGQHKVIGVNDINAYKEFNIQEPGQGFFTMVNSLQQNMSATANGGAQQAIASKQPQSARGVATNQQQVQEAQSNAITMYYDILRQRVLLVVKTALQFYGLEKYAESDESAYRTITVANVPLSLGGIGDMQINITDKKRTDIELFLEGIRQTAKNGKKTEVVDVPLEFLQNVDCEVTDITLEPENQSELDKQNYVANVITPMTQIYIPAGLADAGKVMMRHLEKMGESISDFATEDVMQNMAGNKPTQMAPQGGGPTGQANVSQTQGNAIQSGVGMKFGMNQSGPLQVAQR